MRCRYSLPCSCRKLRKLKRLRGSTRLTRSLTLLTCNRELPHSSPGCHDTDVLDSTTETEHSPSGSASAARLRLAGAAPIARIAVERFLAALTTHSGPGASSPRGTSAVSVTLRLSAGRRSTRALRIV